MFRRFRGALVPLLVTGLLLAATAAVATEITVTYTFPKVYLPNETIITELEGSITARFQADGEIALLEPDPEVIPDGPDAFLYTFVWNETTIPKTVRFLDAVGDTLTVTALPEPVMPLDLPAQPALVFHLTTPPASLWDSDTGIYVWGFHNNCLQTGEEWERPAQLQVYDAQNQLVILETVGLRINGNSSRNYRQKSWRMYFDGYGGSDRVVYDFFGQGPVEFQRLILKSAWVPGFILSASVAEPLHQELGHLGSRLAPAGVYVNDEYWGGYTLRERLDPRFVEETWQLTGDDYVLMKDSEAEHGDPQEWEDFLDLFEPTRPYASHDWYVEVQNRLDLDSYIDWLLINIFGASADNGGINNIATLKLGDGPWQWIMWDEEELFGMVNLQSNHFRFYAAGGPEEYAQFRPAAWSMGGWSPLMQQWFNIFRGLMHNSEFKARFSARCDELLAADLSVTALQARIDAIAASLTPEMDRHTPRWGWWPGYFANTVAAFRNFVALRHPIVVQQKAEFMEHFAVPVELSRFDAERVAGGARLTWRTERERDNQGFVVLRGVGSPDVLEPIASYVDTPELAGQIDSDTPTEYAWTDATAPLDEILYYRLQHVDTGGQTTTVDWTESVGGASPLQLVLNEFLALNATVIADEAGEFDDWLEIHNPGTETVSVAGLYLTDDLTDPAQWALPDTTIPAGGFLLVWCDDDAGQGPLHANFALSGGGEEIGLFTSPASGSQPIDTFVFGPQAEDVSQGRETDGGEPWVFFTTPTPGMSNDGPVAIGEDAPPVGALRARVQPNPFNPRTTIAFALPAAARCDLTIVDLRGRRVAHLLDAALSAGRHEAVWDGTDDRGRAVAGGTYVYRLQAGEFRTAGKLVLVR